MPKTNIDLIFKDGINTKVDTIDYSTPEKMGELVRLKEKSETALSNKETNTHRLSRFIIKPHIMKLLTTALLCIFFNCGYGQTVDTSQFKIGTATVGYILVISGNQSLNFYNCVPDSAYCDLDVNIEGDTLDVIRYLWQEKDMLQKQLRFIRNINAAIYEHPACRELIRSEINKQLNPNQELIITNEPIKL